MAWLQANGTKQGGGSNGYNLTLGTITRLGYASNSSYVVLHINEPSTTDNRSQDYAAGDATSQGFWYTNSHETGLPKETTVIPNVKKIYLRASYSGSEKPTYGLNAEASTQLSATFDNQLEITLEGDTTINAGSWELD